MLARVSKMRGIPPKHEVTSRVLDRAGVLDHIRAHVEKEVPRDAVENEGELLAALELVPPDYDFVEGTYKLIQGRIAGFYEPTDATMYLVDDLTQDEATETLAHELDHALQDQAFEIGGLLRYAPGESDKSSAAHSILEGDATSAMLDVTLGSAFKVSPELLTKLIASANAASDVATSTPHILQTSLAAPYTDGFAFVQRVRAEGGWPAVDAAIRNLPTTTEQLLHADKYASREPPIDVAAPPITALGAGYRRVVDDVIGEQGLRLMLEEWVPGSAGSPVGVPSPRAEAGAAGWGGDRYVIARRGPDASPTLAIGWHAVMDTDRDAGELAEILEGRFGKRCKERPTVGPVAWRRRGRDIALVAGPYTREGRTPHSAGDCRLAGAWLDEILR